MLRSAGLRLTPQRRAVVDALAGDTTHPLAEDVAAKLALRVPGVSLSTVYKTLHEFAAVGLIRELDVGGAMRFDADPAHHAHLVCSECGRVSDFEPPPAAMEQIAAAAGLPVGAMSVTVHATMNSPRGDLIGFCGTAGEGCAGHARRAQW